MDILIKISCQNLNFLHTMCARVRGLKRPELQGAKDLMNYRQKRIVETRYISFFKDMHQQNQNIYKIS